MDRHWTPKPSQLSTETFASLAAINPSISHSPSRTDSSPKGPGFESWCGNVCDSPRNASLAASAARSPPIMERSHQPPTTYRHHIWLVRHKKTRNSHMLDDQNVFNATKFLSYTQRHSLSRTRERLHPRYGQASQQHSKSSLRGFTISPTTAERNSLSYLRCYHCYRSFLFLSRARSYTAYLGKQRPWGAPTELRRVSTLDQSPCGASSLGALPTPQGPALLRA